MTRVCIVLATALLAAPGHSAQAMSRGMLLQLGLATVALGASDEKNGLLVVGGAQLGAALLSQKYSREDESEADRYAMIDRQRAGCDPTAAVELQETFVKISRENGGNGGGLNDLFASHRSSKDRMRAHQKTLQRLGAGGEVEHAAYRQAMALVFKDQSAYGDYNKSREALNNKDNSRAVSLARAAIKAESREGEFYALLGDAAFARKDFSEAETHYPGALKRNGDYFAFHLGAGLVARQLGNQRQAERQLKAQWPAPLASAELALVGALKLPGNTTDYTFIWHNLG